MAVRRPAPDNQKRVRYAVVGPVGSLRPAIFRAFEKCSDRAELAVLATDDLDAAEPLARQHSIPRLYTLEQYEQCVRSGAIDAVWLLSQDRRHEFATGAIKAGIHLLCSKPLAAAVEESETIIEAADQTNVRLMVADTLRFDPIHTHALSLAQRGRIGQVRLFNASYAAHPQPRTAAWSRLDCIQAARDLFQDEPLYVMAFTTPRGHNRFGGAEDITTAILRFPNEGMAVFMSELEPADTFTYRIIGTHGDIRVGPGERQKGNLQCTLLINGHSHAETCPKTQPMTEVLRYFSDCLLTNQRPEPPALEELANARLAQALYLSGQLGRPLSVMPRTMKPRPLVPRRQLAPVEAET